PDETKKEILLPEEDDDHYRLKDEVLELTRVLEEKRGAIITDFSTQEKDDEIRLVFKTNSKIYHKTYELDNPTRLIVALNSKVFSDLPDILNIEQTEIQHIRIKRLPNTNRVTALVIDISYPLEYSIYSDDKNFVIIFKIDSFTL
ncbi:AMIN domain-containing protein, partial [Candidatus Auribacterota bacterium]